VTIEPLTLPFDHAFPYLSAGSDSRPLPRLPVYVTGPTGEERAVAVRPLVDSGAQYSLFDGNVALELGWTEQEIAGRARDARPVIGVSRGAPVVAYQHELTLLISLGRTFAVLRLPAFLTLPNQLTLPVLGRQDFLRQVDFGLVDAEQRFYLRFRDRAVLQDAW
jgi:hypothetical protein